MELSAVQGHHRSDVLLLTSCMLLLPQLCWHSLMLRATYYLRLCYYCVQSSSQRCHAFASPPHANGHDHSSTYSNKKLHRGAPSQRLRRL